MEKTLLSQLNQYSIIVADTGDIDAIKKFQPEDATTNPSLILQAVSSNQYQSLIDDAIDFARKHGKNKAEQLTLACDKIAVNIGCEILQYIPGKISTEIDSRLSFDIGTSIEKAKHIIQLYENAGINKNRVLIKLAATWEGIQAAKQLEKEGIHCNLTLIFNFYQARACAEANVYLISPFVGRILDWYKQNNIETGVGVDDPGVRSVTQIYNYFRQHHYDTIVMGASFRNIEQIIALSGCDRLTIGPNLLDDLEKSTRILSLHLSSPPVIKQHEVTSLTETQFRWHMNEDPMATEKLAEGIRKFTVDQIKLENLLSALLE